MSEVLSLEDLYWRLQKCPDKEIQRELIRELRSRDPGAAGALEKMLRCDREPFMQLSRDTEEDLAHIAPTLDSNSASPASGGINVPKQIGPYKLLEPIGEGGMGLVYLAQQSEPVRRKVALKIIKPGMDSRQVIARFEAERQALAMMEHPNIAKVLDAGTTETGLPYFVMELVRGIPITEYCDRSKMGLQRRLALFRDACSAIQHAHNKGVIHRDIKPSNLLVTEHDGTPVVKVIDFGVAKALTDNLTDKTLFTGMFQMIGTPLYMSPEQASLSNLDVDTRSDVYSLGVMLYELVSGTLPIDRATAKELSFEQLRQRIVDTEPPRPSKRLSTLKDERQTIAERFGVEVKQVHRLVGSELDWVVMRAIEKDRNRRYQSARELGEDVQRYLAGDAVQACPPSASYRLSRYIRRHRVLLSTAACVLISMTIGTLVSLKYAFDSQRFAEAATQAQQTAETESKRAKLLATREAAARERADEESRRAHRTAYTSDIRLAAAQIKQGLQSEAIETLAGQISLGTAHDLRGFEWYHLLGEANQSEQIWQNESTTRDIDWSSDGKLIATVDESGVCIVWDAANGKQLQRHLSGDVGGRCVRFSDDARFLAWGTTSDDARVWIWDRENDSVAKLPQFDGSVWSVRWNRAGNRLLVGCITGSDAPSPLERPNIFLFEREKDRWKRIDQAVFPGNITFANWNHDETRIWAVNQNAILYEVNEQLRIRVYAADRLTKQEVAPHIPRLNYQSASLAHLSSRMAVTDGGGRCIIFDEARQEELTRFQCHWSECYPVWSPDDRFLSTCGVDGYVKIWETESWSLVHEFSGHRGKVFQTAWSPDGLQLASCGEDGQIITWNVNQQTNHIHSIDLRGGRPFFWRDEDHVRFIRDTAVQEIDLATGRVERVEELAQVNAPWRLLSSSLAVAMKDGVIIDCSDPELAKFLSGQDARKLAYSGSSEQQRIAVGLGESTVPRILASERDWEPVTVGSERFFGVTQLDWSPDGKHLAAVGKGLQADDGWLAHASWLYVIDPIERSILRRTQVGKARLTARSVDWSADSRFLAAGTSDGFCGVYRSADLIPICGQHLHRADVSSISFHPGGRLVASGGRDHAVFVWEARSGQVLLNWELGGEVKNVAWSPSGDSLAASTVDGDLYVWDTERGRTFERSNSFANRIAKRVQFEVDRAIQEQSWFEAAGQLERLVQLSQFNDYLPYYRLILLQLLTGERELAKKSLERMWDSVPQDSLMESHFLVWSAVLSPGLITDPEKVLALARSCVDADPQKQQYVLALGAALLRCGRHEEAERSFANAESLSKDTNTSLTYLAYLRAINHWKWGNQQPAIELLERANELAKAELAADPVWNRALTIQLLRDEAGKLIEGVAHPLNAS